jgi:hypothetical protein
VLGTGGKRIDPEPDLLAVLQIPEPPVPTPHQSIPVRRVGTAR